MSTGYAGILFTASHAVSGIDSVCHTIMFFFGDHTPLKQHLIVVLEPNLFCDYSLLVLKIRLDTTHLLASPHIEDVLSAFEYAIQLYISGESKPICPACFFLSYPVQTARRFKSSI